MDVCDLAFYAGDEEFLSDWFKAAFSKLSENSSTSANEIDRALEVGLLLEKHEMCQSLLSRHIESGISRFLHFRVLQTVPDESAYRVLAECFDDQETVADVMRDINQQNEIELFVYELGGLGDIIEGFMTIRALLSAMAERVRVKYIAPRKLAGFINLYLSSKQIEAVSRSEVPTLRRPPIHALHLIAYARGEYGLVPQAITTQRHSRNTARDRQVKSLAQRLMHNIAYKPYVLLNLRSLAKVKPESSRKSYYLRSVEKKTCRDVVMNAISSDLHVIDVTEYPRSWRFEQDVGSPQYISLNYLECEFSDYAFLMENSQETITVDSMLTHLGSALGHRHTLLLARGHDQRWYKNLVAAGSMYKHSCSVYKQVRLHQWDKLLAMPKP